MHVAACFRLVSPLDFQKQEHAKRVPDGHGRSFGSWPWQKGCLMVMANPSDLGHGKKKENYMYIFLFSKFFLVKVVELVGGGSVINGDDPIYFYLFFLFIFLTFKN